MSACVCVCMSALFSLSSVRPFTHPPKDLKGQEWRGELWHLSPMRDDMSSIHICIQLFNTLTLL